MKEVGNEVVSHRCYFYCPFSTFRSASGFNKFILHIFLLKETHSGVTLEVSSIADGEVKVFPQTEIITFILPFGTGQSSDLVQQSKRKNLLIAQCKAGKLHVKVRRQDGSERELPTLEMSDLSKYDIRVNVTGGGGFKQAFFIREYKDFQEDEGPVIDLFGGMIPLQKLIRLWK